MMDTLIDLYIGLVPLAGIGLGLCLACWLTEEWPPGVRWSDKLMGRWMR